MDISKNIKKIKQKIHVIRYFAIHVIFIRFMALGEYDWNLKVL